MHVNVMKVSNLLLPRPAVVCGKVRRQELFLAIPQPVLGRTAHGENVVFLLIVNAVNPASLLKADLAVVRMAARKTERLLVILRLVFGQLDLGALVPSRTNVPVRRRSLQPANLAVVRTAERKTERLLAIQALEIGQSVLGDLAVLECVRVISLNL